MTEHWNTVMDYEGITQVVRRAAERTAKSRPWLVVEDLEQRAWVLLGERPQLLEATHANVLTDWLHKDLVDAVKGRAQTVHDSEQPISTIEETGEDAETEQPVELVSAALRSSAESERVWEQSGGSYSRAEVEYLLIALWDESYGYANPWPVAPGATPPLTRHPAMVADVRNAWNGMLTTEQRQALFLTAVLGWTQAEAGTAMLIGQRAVSGLVTRGMRRMLYSLNGEAQVRQVEVAEAA